MTEIRSPIPGSITLFFVDDGATVKQGQELIGLEAMKMIFPVTATADGVIKLRCKLGQIVIESDILATIE